MATYDFIIIGAGPSGCTLARKLSNSPRRPTVLLLEAGGQNDDRDLRVDGDRWTSFANKSLNWGYITEPQAELNDRPISYDRGMGLGGTSSINFAVYNTGTKDDFDEISRQLGDKDWSWTAIQKRFRDLETYHGGEVDQSLKKYINPQPSHHGSSGPLHVGFPSKWESTLSEMLDICAAAGHDLNPDTNSGNPIGFSVCPSSAHLGLRRTAADFLADAPSNLKVMTNTIVKRIIVANNSVVGVETTSNKIFSATKEVILCAGSIDTPKLLMLSGIGPSETLSKHSIPIVKDLPRVGKGLRDHSHVALTCRRTEHYSERVQYYRSVEAAQRAREQWKLDGSGPLANIGVSLGVGYLKRQGVYDSEEYRRLPQDVRNYLQKPTVPSMEMIVNGPDFRDYASPATSEPATGFFAFIMNPQSEGSIDLKSSDPLDAALINPKFLSHEYDRRVAIEAVRSILELVETPEFAKDSLGFVDAPKSNSDEDILAWWRQNSVSTWHPTCTVSIDSISQPHGCLDRSFRVHGISGLRVGDLSVLPLLPNCHTQSIAYVVGATIGDKLVAEYGLDVTKISAVL